MTGLRLWRQLRRPSAKQLSRSAKWRLWFTGIDQKRITADSIQCKLSRTRKMSVSVDTRPANNPWRTCVVCRGSVNFKSPREFSQHLRDFHCSKEGGSFVCRYGMNGVCPSLPLEGVSDRDYDDHVSRDHVYCDTGLSKVHHLWSNSNWIKCILLCDHYRVYSSLEPHTMCLHARCVFCVCVCRKLGVHLHILDSRNNLYPAYTHCKWCHLSGDFEL